MVIGVLKARLTLRQSRSLKDKRRIVNSLKDRLRNSFNVSVAEVDGQDVVQSATLAVVQVSVDARYVRSSLDCALKVIGRCREAQLADHRIELLSP